jgi:hypothetical protein
MKNREEFILSNKYASDFDLIGKDNNSKRELYKILGRENELTYEEIVIGFLVQEKDGTPIKEFRANQQLEAHTLCFLAKGCS